jgi:hypothetical protein
MRISFATIRGPTKLPCPAELVAIFAQEHPLPAAVQGAILALIRERPRPIIALTVESASSVRPRARTI